jgi:hypothetical protein
MSPFGLSKGADHPLMPGTIWYSPTSANSNLPSHFGRRTLVIKYIQGLGLPHQTTRGSRTMTFCSRIPGIPVDSAETKRVVGSRQAP